MYVSGAIILLGLGYILVRGIRSYFRFRGTRLVICPETTLTAAVKVNALGMAEDTILGTPHLELQTCTRWPERKGCGQACLSQIEEAPEECLVKNIVAKWYATRKCVYCGKPFDNVEDIFHHKPAMLDQDGKSVEWDALPPEALPNNFVNCRPVCWSCHMIETFRREHPDSILNNPWQPRHEGGPVETHHAPAAKPH
jgi:hypothetical protein